jgi:hypothetical protein
MTHSVRNISLDELPAATSWGARKIPAPNTSPTTRITPSRLLSTRRGAASGRPAHQPRRFSPCFESDITTPAFRGVNPKDSRAAPR